MAILDDIIASIEEEIKEKKKEPGEPENGKDPEKKLPKRTGPFNYCDAFKKEFGIE